MNHYQILQNEKELNGFINFLPDLIEGEVFYLSLFARRKYCEDFKDEGQLARFIATKEELKEKILRLESPIGSFIRDNRPVPQEALALYIGINPRSLAKANKDLAIEIVTNMADGKLDFNPISIATSAVHRATSRKIFIDFDYDWLKDTFDNNAIEFKTNTFLNLVKAILPENSFRILRTAGGFHVLANIELVKHAKDWHQRLSAIPTCDVKGTNTLTPVPGCTQGNFTPYFV
jgi:hypothetical protein